MKSVNEIIETVRADRYLNAYPEDRFLLIREAIRTYDAIYYPLYVGLVGDV